MVLGFFRTYNNLVPLAPDHEWYKIIAHVLLVVPEQFERVHLWVEEVLAGIGVLFEVVEEGSNEVTELVTDRSTP
jgi:hypothetical protein